MSTPAPKMPEPPKPAVLPLVVGTIKKWLLTLQDYSILFAETAGKSLSPPIYGGDILAQMDLIGVGSLPIILLTGFFIGGVMVQNTAAQFQRFGSTSVVGTAVALGLVRELGPVIAGLLVTGRNGSAIASELGSMVVTEQVDAMRALGTDPIRKLVVPRVLAMLIVLPLLTACADLVGLFGGFVVSYLTLGQTASQFWNTAIQALALGDIFQGMFKPLVFALIISTIGCFYGLRTHGGTQGVGRSTISAVVVASISVIMVDFFVGKLLLHYFVG